MTILNEIIGTIDTTQAVLLILVGLFWGLLGYSWYRVTLFLVGFAVGAAAGGILGLAFGSSEAALGMALLGGLIAGSLAAFLVKVSIFLLGAAAASVAVLLAGAASGMNVESGGFISFVVIAAVVVGAIAVSAHRFFIILSTAWLGSILIAESTAQLADIEMASYLLLLLGLFGVFSVLQYVWTSRGRETVGGGEDREAVRRGGRAYVRTCPKCGYAKVTSFDTECPECGFQLKDARGNPVAVPARKPAETADGGWICAKCGTTNRGSAAICKSCGEYR